MATMSVGLQTRNLVSVSLDTEYKDYSIIFGNECQRCCEYNMSATGVPTAQTRQIIRQDTEPSMKFRKWRNLILGSSSLPACGVRVMYHQCSRSHHRLPMLRNLSCSFSGTVSHVENLFIVEDVNQCSMLTAVDRGSCQSKDVRDSRRERRTSTVETYHSS